MAFKYLGWVLMVGDDAWLTVVGNIGKAIKSWGQLSRILTWVGADPKVSGHFYKAVSQAGLMFGAETWVLNPRIERDLDSFQHRVVQRLTGRQMRRRGGWELGLPTIGGGNGRSRLRRNQEIRHEEAVHGCAVYCNVTNY